MFETEVKVVSASVREELEGKKGYYRVVEILVDNPELFNQLKDGKSVVKLSVSEVVRITNEKRNEIFEELKNLTIVRTGQVKPSREELSESKQEMYAKFEIRKGIEEFSVSSCSMDEAEEFLSMIKDSYENPFSI